MTHELKILECYATAKVNGEKLFEIRDNSEHGFQKGDYVKYKVLCDYKHTLEEKLYQITYVTNYEQKDGYVVFGEKEV